MSVLVLAEHEAGKLKLSTHSTITAASQLNLSITVLVAGKECDAVIEEAASYENIDHVIYASHSEYEYPLAERLALLVVHHANNYTHLLAPATTFGKNIMPRVAALLDVGQISDVIEIVDNQTYRRPIYAGNAIATVKSLDAQQVITVRPTAFKLAQTSEKKSERIQSNYLSDNKQSSFISKNTLTSGRPDLNAAEIVISGGRGLQSETSFKRLTQIADKMNAAIGASRAAVDAGFAPNDWQVGQTGQVVAPKLYVAVGISGATQHLAGMKESKVIVAINKDPDAPIFQVADYGLVADIHDIFPLWEKELEI